MIFRMLAGDVLRFFSIYSVFMLAFSAGGRPPPLPVAVGGFRPAPIPVPLNAMGANNAPPYIPHRRGVIRRNRWGGGGS